MSDEIIGIWKELQDLRTRVFHLEALECPSYLAFTEGVCIADGNKQAPGLRFCDDPDTGFYRYGDNQIGILVGGATAGYWGPGLNVGTATGAGAGDGWFSGSLRQVPSSVSKRFVLVGEKTSGISDDTYFDILEFNCAIAGTSTTGGACSGVLTLLVRGLDTGGYCQWKVIRYHITIGHTGLEFHQTELSSDVREHDPITVTIQATGITSTYAKVQAKFTWDDWDTDYPTAAWMFDCISHARLSTVLLTPSVA